jgi:signal transduction histidine kinase
VGSPVLEMLWPLVPLALGEAVRARHELLAEHAARAARAEADREREARHRVEAERVRIAREFHDVVAHTLAAVNVQMGVAVAAFDTRPDTARQALVQARASSKQALHELRATIALLRDPTSTSPPAPAPRLTQIDELAETTRGAGILVTVHDGTDGDELPAAVELAAYRIIQEALTNAARHGDGEASVVLEFGSDALELTVANPVGGERAAAEGGGHGIVGMRERAALLGGTLRAGPRDGRFEVHARLPLTGRG